MKLSELLLNRFLYRQSQQNLETKDAVYDSSNVIPVPVPPVAAGGAAQDINTSNTTINGDTITPGTFPPSLLDVANWGWGQTSIFSSTDADTVSWGAGTFKSANGEVYSIGSGNTGNMAAKTYVYLDLNVSSTAYQTTTVPATAVGIGKVLIAVANPGATEATYNLSEATQIVGDNILANTINATKLNVGVLSAISANLGTITAGSIALGTDRWHIDTNGNMWWGSYATYADALDKVSGDGFYSRVRIVNNVTDLGFYYVNQGNVLNTALYIDQTGVTNNTNPAITVIRNGAGRVMDVDIQGAGQGIFMNRSVGGGTAEFISLLSTNAASPGSMVKIQAGGSSAGAINGVEFDLVSATTSQVVAAIRMSLATGVGGIPAAFAFDGSEKGITAAGNAGFVSNNTGTLTVVGYIRVRVGSNTYFMPYGTIA